MVACPIDGSMTSAFIVMIVPFINLHTKLKVQVFYFILSMLQVTAEYRYGKCKLRIQTQVDCLRYGQKLT